MIYLIFGILVATLFYPTLICVADYVQIFFELQKSKMALKITSIQSDINRITDEQDKEIVHNVIGFQTTNSYEEEDYFDD